MWVIESVSGVSGTMDGDPRWPILELSAGTMASIDLLGSVDYPLRSQFGLPLVACVNHLGGRAARLTKLS